MNRNFQRRLECPWFTLTNAEALGVKLRHSIETDYPRCLTVSCATVPFPLNALVEEWKRLDAFRAQMAVRKREGEP
jgi:hypothetical protein